MPGYGENIAACGYSNGCVTPLSVSDLRSYPPVRHSSDKLDNVLMLRSQEDFEGCAMAGYVQRSSRDWADFVRWIGEASLYYGGDTNWHDWVRP